MRGVYGKHPAQVLLAEDHAFPHRPTGRGGTHAYMSSEPLIQPVYPVRAVERRVAPTMGRLV